MGSRGPITLAVYVRMSPRVLHGSGPALFHARLSWGSKYCDVPDRRPPLVQGTGGQLSLIRTVASYCTVCGLNVKLSYLLSSNDYRNPSRTYPAGHINDIACFIFRFLPAAMIEIHAISIRQISKNSSSLHF